VQTTICPELFAEVKIFPTFASRFGGRETVKRIREKDFERRVKRRNLSGFMIIGKVLRP